MYNCLIGLELASVKAFSSCELELGSFFSQKDEKLDFFIEFKNFIFMHKATDLI